MAVPVSSLQSINPGAIIELFTLTLDSTLHGSSTVYRFHNGSNMKTNDDIVKLYSDIPEALENNYNFHLRFNFKPKKSKPILPSISHSENTAEEELFNQASDGLDKRLKNFIIKKNIVDILQP